MTETKNEVNTESEELKVNLDGEVEGDDGDEVIVPPDESEDETKEPEDSAPESSTGEKRELEPEVLKQPKPVEWETPREKALRLEVQKLREERRGGIKTPQSQSQSDRLTELKKIYTDEEIKNMEEVVDVIATSKGYVKKEQNYQDTANQVLEDFIEENPEYKPINDWDDLRWGAFQEILARDYNISNKTPKQIKQIYQKVNRDVREYFGDDEKTQTRTNERQINAQAQKIKSVSHAGGTKPSSKKLDIDPEVRSMFKGFTDEDLA